MEWLLSIVAGFTLGCLHAFDVDHLSAVTAFTTRNPDAKQAARFGVYWGLGHTATLFVLGTATVVFKFAIPASVVSAAELVVGVLLLLIGAWTLKEVFQRKHIHVHHHSHDGVEHAHFHSHSASADHVHHHSIFAVGATHGLAGTASVMVIVPMAIVQSLWSAVVYLLLFGVGTILAMTIFAYTIGRVAKHVAARNLLPWFRGLAGFASLAIGIVWIWAKT